VLDFGSSPQDAVTELTERGVCEVVPPADGETILISYLIRAWSLHDEVKSSYIHV
jgi:hypothetical protein